MPLFEYKCPKCGQVMERFHVTPKERIVCTNCNNYAPRVEWSVPAKRDPSHGIQR